MFEGELASNDIAMEFRMEMSYLDMNIDWVKLDPSRLLQVLINLTTNAIKFTNGQDERAIVVTIGASSAPPNGTDSDVDYFPTRSKHTDLTIDEAEWGKGENIYLKFAVQDTGRGLDESEMALLFQRFRQASPRTHVQYGGSGLGLFISRELTELQGGEIGVSSERGIGSTFAFYIKARRVEHMPQQTPILASLNSLRRSSTNDASVSFTIESRRNSSGKPVQLSNTSGKIRRTSALTSTSFPSLPSASTLDYSKLKVLIVEDNLVNQRVLQKQLRNLGFNVEVANHGGEALEVLKNSRLWAGREEDGKELAVILMDLEMPVMDGLTCARTIRVLEGEGTIIKHVPIIAVTANARLEQIESAISAGMVSSPPPSFTLPPVLSRTNPL
jgi:CheY-like chemotaxis protein